MIEIEDDCVRQGGSRLEVRARMRGSEELSDSQRDLIRSEMRKSGPTGRV